MCRVVGTLVDIIRFDDCSFLNLDTVKTRCAFAYDERKHEKLRKSNFYIINGWKVEIWCSIKRNVMMRVIFMPQYLCSVSKEKSEMSLHKFTFSEMLWLMGRHLSSTKVYRINFSIYIFTEIFCPRGSAVNFLIINCVVINIWSLWGSLNGKINTFSYLVVYSKRSYSEELIRNTKEIWYEGEQKATARKGTTNKSPKIKIKESLGRNQTFPKRPPPEIHFKDWSHFRHFVGNSSFLFIGNFLLTRCLKNLREF